MSIFWVLDSLPILKQKFQSIAGVCLVQSCQVDLVKDGGHCYFIRYLDSPNVLPEQRAMAAFVLTVIVDGHPRGQQACIQANLIGICLSHLQQASNVTERHSEPLLLQWLCLCLGKLWEGSSVGIAKALHDNAPAILGKILSEPQPEVRRYRHVKFCTVFCYVYITLNFLVWILHNFFRHLISFSFESTSV